MAIQTRNKGNRVRLKCRKELESQGYLVDIAEKIGNMFGQKDLFGLFDLIAIKKNETKYIQVTCNKPHTASKYKYFATKYGGKNLLVEQWVWIDRKGWRIIDYT